VVSDGSFTGNPLVTTATSVTIDFGSVSGSVGVIAQNTCGNSGTKALSVTLTNCERMFNEAEVATSIFPNPVKEFAEIKYVADKNGIATIQLYDLSGRIIYSNNVLAQQGLNEFPVYFTSTAKGAYILSVIQDGNSVRLPVLVE